jgi:protein-arginine kinase activator protein McsA
VKRSTLRCSACGQKHPVDELIADIHREEAARLYICRRCAQQELEEAEEAYAP